MGEIGSESIKFYFENEILCSEYLVNTNINLDVAIETIRLRHEISNSQHQYYCADISKVKTYNKEARDYVEKYGQDFIHACAMLVNSHITKFIFNTFVATKNVVVPFKAFKTKESAVKWLLEVKKQNELITDEKN